MSEKKKPDNADNSSNKPNIPQVAFPLKARESSKNTLQHYFNRLANDPTARFLFNQSGLWHQGIHIRPEQFSSSDYYNNEICAIADGKLIAYKVDSEYKTDNQGNMPYKGAVYSTGFFLLEHHLEYPQGNHLTFYSLYRHTAKLSEYKTTISNIIGEVKSADKSPVMIRDHNNQSTGKSLADGVTILVRKHQDNKTKFDELVWYRDKAGIEHKADKGHWRIFRDSYQTMQEETVVGIPLLSANNLDTQVDKEVKLAEAIEIKAGTVLGLMGEYNQKEEQGKKLLHLEVFSYDDIETFRTKAKAAYDKDKTQDKAKRALQDNFLYADRNSPYYSIVEDKAVEIGKTSTEVMVPLSEIEKKTVKDGDKTKDYYNIQPYLHSTTANDKTGIYVDDSHLTHGILFPGVNVFNQASDSLCIFQNKLHEYINPNSELTLMQKNELDPLFKAIMEELDLAEDKGAPITFEAGKLKDLLLNPIQQRRLTGIIAKHENEWKKTRLLDFKKVCEVYTQNNAPENAARIEKRVEDLSIGLKVNEFDTDKEGYYIHPLGMISLLLRIPGKIIDREYFFAQYEKELGKLTSKQKNALEKIFSGIEEYYEQDKNYICDLKKIAYMLATAKHETGHTFEPITEKGPRSYFNKYDPILADTPKRRKVARDNGNINKGDGYKYRGRGYVQLTWFNNYEKSGKYLKKDLVNNPELALDQKDATKIMVYGMETGMFTGRKYQIIFLSRKTDYLNARRVINGLDRANDIAICL